MVPCTGLLSSTILLLWTSRSLQTQTYKSVHKALSCGTALVTAAEKFCRELNRTSSETYPMHHGTFETITGYVPRQSWNSANQGKILQKPPLKSPNHSVKSLPSTSSWPSHPLWFQLFEVLVADLLWPFGHGVSKSQIKFLDNLMQFSIMWIPI